MDGREILSLKPWALPAAEVLLRLSSGEEGLSSEEVLRRRAVFGPNVIPEDGRRSVFSLVLGQLRSPLILILIVAGVVTAALQQWLETGVISAAVMLNAALGFMQEWKAESVMAMLKRYVRTTARVRREGRELEISTEELLPGDVIRITQGDRIPADARILFSKNFEVDESILTGEALPAEKADAIFPEETVLPERSSMVFLGTLAVAGFADAAVTGTGVNTEFGRIARLASQEERVSTPLQKSISRFALWVGILLTLFTVLLFAIGIQVGYGFFEMFLVAVAVAVSAVPEGLPIAVTVILAVGVQRIAGQRGIVRRLLAAETLGSTSIILTDKTGTLTEANMSLSSVLSAASGPEGEKELLMNALFNIDAVVENPGDDSRHWNVLGKPLEAGLIKGAAERGVFLPHLSKEITFHDRLPFSSDRKFSASIVQYAERARLTLFGAPEILLEYAQISPDVRLFFLKEVESRARNGERVLGVAVKSLSGQKGAIVDLLEAKNLQFLGIISFRDPLRTTVKSAIREIGEAGVKTVIVTGDHRLTAEAVAREAGILEDRKVVILGRELSAMSEADLTKTLGRIAVFARVTPEQKMQIVERYQSLGEVVAVTGDGVNDAPALKRADIGVAVGSGTEVAKQAADLVLLDDNFEIITAAIREGRRITENIRKVVVYLLSSVLDELFLIGGALLIGLPLPLNALQILYVNFFSDGLPAIAFAFDKGGAASRLPRNSAGFFDRQVRFLIFVVGIITSAFLFLMYWLLLSAGRDEDLVRTFIFASFGTYALFLSFALRDLRASIIRYNPLGNLYITGGVVFGLGLMMAALYLPFLQQIFKTVPLPPVWLFGVFIIGVLNVAAVEFGKRLFRESETAGISPE